MAKFKIDVTGLKQFLFAKGEKVALFGCTAIMLLVVGYSLYSGLTSGGSTSGKAWEKDIEDHTRNLLSKIQSADLGDDQLPAPIDPSRFRWLFMPSGYSFVPLFPLPDKVSSKKLNPKILQPLAADDPKHLHVDYLRGDIFCYRIDTKDKKAWILDEKAGGGVGAPGMSMPAPGGNAPRGAFGGNAPSGGGQSNLAKDVRAVRMLVVSGVFPMQDQLDEFRKALRYATVEELLAHRDELPTPIGIEVERCEVLPGGKVTEWKPMLKFDARTGKLTVAANIRSLMREMLIDEEEAHKVANYIFPGLVTPLPKLANVKYAKVKLKDFDVKEMAEGQEDKKPAGGQVGGNSLGPAPFMPGKNKPGMEQPGGGGAAAAVGKITPIQWSKLTKELQDKFTEKYFPDTMLDPLGSPPATTTDRKGAGSAGPGVMAPGQGAATSIWGWDNVLGGAGQVGGPGLQQPGGEADPNKAEATKALTLRDALIRFFDPDVQPGKTYRYTYRVRMANPNYNKKGDVAFQALADQKELDWKDPAWQGWTITPAITIPGDFFWYAVDVEPNPKIKGGADAFPPYPTARPETTPIQVHSWQDRASDEVSKFELGDWAIAERLYVRRGDLLGRQGVMVEVPYWRDDLQAFEIAHSAQVIKSRPKAGQPKEGMQSAGIPVNMLTAPPSVVVDFDGGKRTVYSYEKRDGSRESFNVSDASAVDILVLSPDGKLMVRNSRVDSEAETHAGVERNVRFEAWRDRLREVRGGGAGGAAAGPAMPGGR